MARNSITVQASAEAIFTVLDDAYAYPKWVVGTRRVRRVDDDWPAEGSEFHHAIGNAAGELHDSSMVLERDAPRHLALEVRFRPTGIARVDIRITEHDGGHEVTIEETPTGGLFAHLPRIFTDPPLTVRNAHLMPFVLVFYPLMQRGILTHPASGQNVTFFPRQDRHCVKIKCKLTIIQE